jgi:hypothetical protein
MRQILLLAAIYSLIFHQSHKNAKEKIFWEEPKTKVTKAASLPGRFYLRYTAPGNGAYVNAGFMIHTILQKQNEKNNRGTEDFPFKRVALITE